MESLLQLDQFLFEFINSDCQNFIFDAIVPIWRNKLFWTPLYIFLFFFLIINFKQKGLYVVVGLLLTIAITDFTSSQVIKKNVKRLRPCKQELPIEVHTLITCGSGYSFPSSHASNHFGIALFLIGVLGFRFRWIKLPLLFWAASIALGQVYVGVHFPIDIFAGAILGSMVGVIVSSIFNMISPLELSINSV